MIFTDLLLYAEYRSMGRNPHKSWQDNQRKERARMFTPTGYYTHSGFLGFLPDGSRMVFATYADYVDYLEVVVAA